jgi:hypothetical protein
MVGLSVTGVTTPSGITVGWFTPVNVSFPTSGQISFQMVGYLSEAAAEAQESPIPDMVRYYDLGGEQNNITEAVYSQYFASVEDSTLPSACCQAAMAAQDVVTANGAVSFFANATQTT